MIGPGWILTKIFLDPASRSLKNRKKANLSTKAIGCQWFCLYVFLFVCSLNTPKRLILMSWSFEGWFPLGCRWFRPKVRLKTKNTRACTVVTSKTSVPFNSYQSEFYTLLSTQLKQQCQDWMISFENVFDFEIKLQEINKILQWDSL